MKNIIYTLTLLLAFISAAYSQRCGTTVAAIAPLPATGIPGFTPSFSQLPCIDSGTYVSDTIYFESFAGWGPGPSLPVDYIRIDSIYLPAGLCWETSNSSDTIGGGSTGVIYISGLCTAPVGQYKMKMIVDIAAAGTMDTDQDFEYNFRSRYYLRVKNPMDTCPYFDLVDSTLLFIPYDANFHPSAPTGPNYIITASGPLHACDGDHITLSVPYNQYYAYQWNNGGQDSSITVSTSFTYSLTVTTFDLSNPTIIPPPVTVVFDRVQADFTMVPDTVPHHWIAMDSSSSSAGFPLSFVWTWGDSTSSSGYDPVHTYSTPGYYDVCVTVSDPSGCQDTYCDSSTYLSKNNAAATVTVLSQAPNGIADIKAYGCVRVYPNPAANTLILESHSGQNKTAAIYNAFGQMIRQINISSEKTEIDISDLADGVYILSGSSKAFQPVRFVISR